MPNDASYDKLTLGRNRGFGPGGMSTIGYNGQLSVRYSETGEAVHLGASDMYAIGALGSVAVFNGPLEVNSTIRQNQLYLSGGAGWSSLSYNAYHVEGNSEWVFPDKARPAVTLEMDDANAGKARFEVWSTTTAAKEQWVRRLGMDGETGDFGISRNLTVGAGGNGILKVRHIDGKSYLDDSADALYLNYNTVKPVCIGGGVPDTNTPLWINGEIVASNLTISANTQRQISTNAWADLSANSSGYGLFAGNAYVIYDGQERFKYANTHDLIGAIGFAVNYPEWNAASVISSGGTASSANQDFVPSVIATFRYDQSAGMGTLEVNGDVILAGADCAEDFEIVGAETVDAGTVMVIDQTGNLKPSEEPYNRRVAGVISGAGELKPGITLGKQVVQDNRLPLALAGKVYCKVDAQFGPIDVGDMLTTSATPGYAMKASDPSKAFGAVIGKALSSLQAGTGLIPIIVALA